MRCAMDDGKSKRWLCKPRKEKSESFLSSWISPIFCIDLYLFFHTHKVSLKVQLGILELEIIFAHRKHLIEKKYTVHRYNDNQWLLGHGAQYNNCSLNTPFQMKEKVYTYTETVFWFAWVFIGGGDHTPVHGLTVSYQNRWHNVYICIKKGCVAGLDANI